MVITTLITGCLFGCAALAVGDERPGLAFWLVFAGALNAVVWQ